MVKVHILSGTDRPGSNALKVSRYATNMMAERANTELFSLEQFPLADVAGGVYGNAPQSVKDFNEKFMDADGFLFVIPEYNGGFPGILKVFVDYLPFPKALQRVPVSVIGEADGTFGALRPVEQFEQILTYRKAIIYPERMFIQNVNSTFDEKKGLKSEKLQKLFEKQLRCFPDFVEKLDYNLVNA
ncbi:MAG: NAD(P)H-dependent oxidoreductase [Balneolaceae bacterium]|nr:NAD(P)H-dependent oxidoreductase [Balneolaceae bacterium]